MGNNYGEAFRIERERLKLSQKTVAAQIGVSGPSISLRENGIRKITAWELHKVYVLFGLDIGFGKVFDRIDNEDTENILSVLPLRVQENIKNKKYEDITVITLEKIKEILENEKIYSEIEMIMTEEERQRLIQILKEYKNRDGNIEKAIRILEVLRFLL